MLLSVIFLRVKCFATFRKMFVKTQAGINKAQLVGSGLSDHVVDELFKSSMTIKMNVTGSARLVTDATITCNMRLFGD